MIYTLELLVETATISASLFVVLIGAWTFSNFFNTYVLPRALSDCMVAYNLHLGWSLLLMVPIFCLIMTNREHDRFWVGIFTVVVMQLNLIWPLVGLNVFVRKGVL